MTQSLTQAQFNEMMQSSYTENEDAICIALKIPISKRLKFEELLVNEIPSSEYNDNISTMVFQTSYTFIDALEKALMQSPKVTSATEKEKAEFFQAFVKELINIWAS